MEKDFIEQAKREFEKIFKEFEEESAGLRTERATLELVDSILVDCYGTKTPLNQVAQISILEGKTYVVEPWDKSILKNIEKALAQADLGAQPNSDENVVRLTLPPLSEERRKMVFHHLKEKAEHFRQKARIVRDEIKEKIKKSFENKEISEDEKYQFLKKLDEAIGDFNKKVLQIIEDKEKEILGNQ